MTLGLVHLVGVCVWGGVLSSCTDESVDCLFITRTWCDHAASMQHRVNCILRVLRIHLPTSFQVVAPLKCQLRIIKQSNKEVPVFKFYALIFALMPIFLSNSNMIKRMKSPLDTRLPFFPLSLFPCHLQLLSSVL